MIAICFTATFLYRYADSLSVLAAAALIILAWDPGSLRQISFQLSFACMLAIFAVYPHFRPLHFSRRLRQSEHPAAGIAMNILKHPEEAFWVSVAVNVLVIPLTVFYFQGISVSGFFANIILVPIVGFLVVPSGLLALALYPVAELPARLVLHAGTWFLQLTKWIILFFGRPSWAYFTTGNLSIPWMIAWYGILWVLLRPASRRSKAIRTMLILVTVTCPPYVERLWSTPANGLLRVDSIDVGQGIASLLRFPDGKTMLVDGGGFLNDTFDVGRAVVAPYLWREGVRKLDCVVLSHDHPDHRNGLRFILSNFDVGCFWETGIADKGGSETVPAVIAKRRGIPVRRINEIYGDHAFGAYIVKVIHPSPAYINEAGTKDLNNISQVIQVDYANTHVVLPGDIDHTVEEKIFAGAPLPGRTLLMAAHHGSKRSTGWTALEGLHPVALVFSCGRDNNFGFPAQRIIDECRRRGIAVYRTDLQGAIRAISDGKDWTVTTILDNGNRNN